MVLGSFPNRPQAAYLANQSTAANAAVITIEMRSATATVFNNSQADKMNSQSAHHEKPGRRV
jgi:hypothetical protein